MIMRRLFHALAAGLLSVAVGCAADIDENEDEDEDDGEVVWQTHDELIGGTPNGARPEVGLVRSATGFCTGTLVASNVVLTAGHCGRATSFTINGRSTFQVSARRIWSTAPGPNDLALLRLSTRVSPQLASPAGLASGPPRQGASVTTFGYGCTRRGTRNGSGVKRSATYPYLSGRQQLCPGTPAGPPSSPARCSGSTAATAPRATSTARSGPDEPRWWRRSVRGAGRPPRGPARTATACTAAATARQATHRPSTAAAAASRRRWAFAPPVASGCKPEPTTAAVRRGRARMATVTTAVGTERQAFRRSSTGVRAAARRPSVRAPTGACRWRPAPTIAAVDAAGSGGQPPRQADPRRRVRFLHPAG
jgi:hypothetical protein